MTVTAPSPTTPEPAATTPRVTVHPHGLLLAGNPEPIPLYSGAIHYFRMAPEEWGRALDAMKAMGLGMVDIYVPWGVHETSAENFEWGQKDPWLDLPRFLAECGSRGLHVVLRPGPHINAELTFFGLPERIVWNGPCQARTARQSPVILPMLPRAFPVPSYASDAFHEAAALWLTEVARVTAPFLYPDGPIVMVQIDNEGAAYFRDGLYDQDYHPDAIRMFRDFLRKKYQGGVHELRAAWQEADLQFATTDPPTRMDAETADQLARHLDWAEFHEDLLATAFERLAAALRDGGLAGIPTMHNMPPGEAGTSLNAERMRGAIDLVALDYYHSAEPGSHGVLERRTGELVSRTRGHHLPAFAAEMGAGYPPFFAPTDEKDSLYTLLAGLAYGLRGFSLYMAVDRDRWVGAPIDVHGYPRKHADDYRRVTAALRRLDFHTLERRTPVRLVLPRNIRRLARATHAFGPITQAAFAIAGASYRESCLEDDFGLGEVPTFTAEAYLLTFERALRSRGVPYAHAGGEGLTAATRGAAWIVCALAGGIKPAFVETLAALPAKVTAGPALPERDGNFQPLAQPFTARGIEIVPLEDAADVDRLVAKRIEELALPTYTATPDDIHVTVHHDPGGTLRAVFVMNPTAAKITARVAVPGVAKLVDLLEPNQATVAKRHGVFEMIVEPRSVRLFEAR